MRQLLTAFLFISIFSGAWGAPDLNAENISNTDATNLVTETAFPDAPVPNETRLETQPPVTADDALQNDLAPPPDCATTVFANALAVASDDVMATDDEYAVQTWIYQTFQNPDVIKQVLACPEIAAAADDETIQFQPVEYVFADGNRRITINYATQPKILKQRLVVANKRSLPETDRKSVV